ncbi:MAG TPA: hypothetical protein VN822_05410 [Candidatus Acidoferrales bacterium]|nr:hypothetical protein [Candidatus Acidoferrales bacterium]
MKVRAKFMRICWAAIAAAVLAISGVAYAQSGPPVPPPGPQGRHGGFGPMSDDALGFVGFEAGLGGKTVTGAPFSASFSSQTTQTLADGNQIQRSSSGTFARDGQGRTRRDMTLPAIGPWATSGQAAPHVVFINDSVAAAQYILEPDRKIARKTARPPHGKRGAGAAPDAQFAPPAGMRGNRNNVVTTSLGTQTINGVQAEGTRTTRTIPAGAIGNANPITITTERWYSSDLQTVVMTKRSDPRMGETTFQLTNVQRREPDASLFQVPSDYTVKQGGNRRFGRRLPPPPGAPAGPPPPQD